jgi:pyruvate formate lyase activating enzyme
MMPQAPTLRQLLERESVPAGPELVRREDGDLLRCLACGHRCRIPDGQQGICKVRWRKGEELLVPWGYVAGIQVDPVEKKPFYHVLPGSQALSFGMLGCDLHCGYCQNWVTSQALRDPAAGSDFQRASPERISALAIEQGAPIVVSTYNEPLITAEWSHAVFERAQERGLRCGFVSNGNATPEVLRYMRPVTDFYKVDLKGFDDARYRKLGGVLSNVLRSLEDLRSLGYWIEVVTLLVPGFNDDDSELRALCAFLAGLDREIPWHVTAFRPDYKMRDSDATSANSLLRACEIGEAAGLRYIYAGNLPGAVGDRESTFCPGCGATVVERHGFRVTANRLESGRCPSCSASIPGVWN